MANLPKFFSAALEAAQRIQQKRGTGQQLKSMLKTYGAKQKELDYLDVDKQYKDTESYKTQDLVDYLDARQVKPEEVLYTGAGDTSEQATFLNEVADAMIRANSADVGEAKMAMKQFEELTGTAWDQGSGRPGELERAPSYELQHITPERVADGVGTDDPLQDREFDEAYQTARELFGDKTGNTKWSQYVTGEPSERYTEHLVTLPDEPTAGTGDYRDSSYESPHWEEPNVLAHMRYDYDPDALRLEEIQSDWLQQARDKGFRMTPDEIAEHARKQQDASHDYLNFRDALARKYGFSASEYRVPGALMGDVYKYGSPDEQAKYVELSNRWNDLKNKTAEQRFALPRAPLANVNDWTSMMLRRAMLEAAEQDKTRLRWTSGLAQDRRYSPQPGRAKYYDEIIPNLATRIARPYGDAQVMSQNWAEGAMGRPRGQADRWNRDTGEMIGGDEIDMHYIDLPPKLIEALQKRGKVPFFKDGGAVG